MIDLGGSIALIMVVFAIQIVLSAGLLWFAMKLLGEEGRFVALIIACVIASVISLIPYIGWLLGLIALIVLITKFTSAGGFTAILMVIISWAITVAIVFALGLVFFAEST